MNIVYAGAPAFSVPPLQALLDAGFAVAAVVTQPDKPVGRKGVLTPTPLKAFAAERGIPVFCFARIRDEAETLRALGADCMVTCAYGQLLTQEVLDLFAGGVYNIHASLLPRWRGASPIQHAILAGDAQTGITVMRTDIGLDTGDILFARALPVEPADTAGTLSEKLSRLGGEAILEALTALSRGEAHFTPQGAQGATLCKKIEKSSCLVSFAEDAGAVCRLIRAMNPAPLAYAYLRGTLFNFYFAEPVPCEEDVPCGTVVRADKTGIYVRAGQGAVRIAEAQAAGGKRMSAADLVNGRKIAVGDMFGGIA